MNDNTEIGERFREFYHTYYRDDVLELAEKFPSDQESLWITYDDLYQFDPDLADDWRNHPDEMQGYAQLGLEYYDLPIDVSLEGAHVRLSGLPDEYVYDPSELRNEHVGRYIGVKGDLSRITTPDTHPESVEFECQRCGTPNMVDQGREFTEPHACVSCERQGPFVPNWDQSVLTNYSRVKVETPPDAASQNGSDNIAGYAKHDLPEYGSEIGLFGRAGEKATVYGKVELVEKENTKAALLDKRLHIRAVDFDDDDSQIDIQRHKAEFEELAEREDAVELWAQSLCPQLYNTPAWEVGVRVGIKYLFGTPRIHTPEATFRGDIHFSVVSDFGMGKSLFSGGIEAYSPKCVKKSATAFASDANLLAAATKDDFGEGQWVIQPGVLVRGNGGHVILDEIDKGPDDLEKMNDALEGEQIVDVEKAGKSATYNSKVGLLALGNPEDGRFEPSTAIAPQLGVDSSLLSRFDAIITMSDKADVEIDGNVAERMLDAYAEASQSEYGNREELETLDRPISLEVGRAWVKYARENIHPVPSKEVIGQLKDWYAEEVRQLNNQFGNGNSDMPVPATPRVVMAAVRFAVANARLHLREELTQEDIDRAKDLTKSVVSQDWNDGIFDPAKTRGETTQADKMTRLENAIPDDEAKTPGEIASTAGLNEGYATDALEKLAQKGEVLEPQQGEYRSV